MSSLMRGRRRSIGLCWCLGRNAHQKFSKILAAQEADEGSGCFPKPLNYVFAILDPSLADPGGDIVHEISITPDKVGDDEPAKRQPLSQDCSHHVGQEDGTG